jgi:hypothetical protein
MSLMTLMVKSTISIATKNSSCFDDSDVTSPFQSPPALKPFSKFLQEFFGDGNIRV